MKNLITTIILSMAFSMFSLSAVAHNQHRGETMHDAIDRSCNSGKVKLILKSGSTGEKINADVNCDDAKRLAHHKSVKVHGIHLVK